MQSASSSAGVPYSQATAGSVADMPVAQSAFAKTTGGYNDKEICDFLKALWQPRADGQATAPDSLPDALSGLCNQLKAADPSAQALQVRREVTKKLLENRPALAPLAAEMEALKQSADDSTLSRLVDIHLRAFEKNQGARKNLFFSFIHLVSLSIKAPVIKNLDKAIRKHAEATQKAAEVMGQLNDLKAHFDRTDPADGGSLKKLKQAFAELVMEKEPIISEGRSIDKGMVRHAALAQLKMHIRTRIFGTEPAPGTQLSRAGLSSQFLDQLPASITLQPGWAQVKQRMANYLQHTDAIQGHHFDTLLSHAIKNGSVQQLMASFRFEGALPADELEKMALQRELWNIAMGAAPPNQNSAALGCERSYANQMAGKTLKGQVPDCLKPGNQLSITMQTPIRKQSGEIVNITVVSCYAPALDTSLQPEFQAYVKTEKDGNGKSVQKLDGAAYQVAFDRIRQQVLAAAKANPDANPVALPAIGMNAFLSGLTRSQREPALGIGTKALAELAAELRAEGKRVLISDLNPGGEVWTKVNDALASMDQPPLDFGGPIPGDWITDNTLVLNAWDPHSLLGNGLGSDPSFDGYLGRSTLIHFMHALHCAAHAEGIDLRTAFSQADQTPLRT